jgi:proteasome accessory factor B
LRPETGHALRLRGTVIGAEGDWDLVEVTYRYDDALRDEVLGLGGMARVVAPPEIADDVRRHARAVIDVVESAPLAPPGSGVHDG